LSLLAGKSSYVFEVKMSRFFAFIWQLEELDSQWTLLCILGNWIFPKYCQFLGDARIAEAEADAAAKDLSESETVCLPPGDGSPLGPYSP